MKESIKNLSFGKGLITLLLFVFAIDLSGQTEEKIPLPQFLFPKFIKGIVKMKAGNTYSASINYNMVDEEMIFEQKGVYMVLDKPQLIDTVFIQNRCFVPFDKAFYEVVYKGPITFFIQHKAKYTQVPSTTAYGMKSPTNATYAVKSVQGGNQIRHLDVPDNVTVSTSPLYWVRKNNEMEKFNGQRQFIKIFPEKEAELKSFISKENLNVKNREDLIKLGIYCNEILK